MNAYLEHGRWIVACSADDCRAVLFADRSVCECNDESVCDHLSIPCGAPIIAVFPDDREDIDRLVGRRPRRLNRNWKEGETVEALKAENLLHGVGI